MYEIIKNQEKQVNPHFHIIFEYMIGDGDGETIKECDVYGSMNKEMQEHLHLLQKYASLSLSGYWGINFDKIHFRQALEEKKITQDEYKILLNESYEYYDFDEDEEELKMLDSEIPTYFTDCILTYCEFSFYTIRHIIIEYIDEHGIHHAVKWKD